MTEAVFQAPKRRARVYESYEAPFPVLGYENEADLEQHIYRAEIVNQHVIVRDPKHIEALYGKGYFGKGILSRSRPQHSISDTWKNFSDRCLPVISFSKYQQHVQWAQDVLLSQGLDEDAVREILEKFTHPTESKNEEEEETTECEEALRSLGQGMETGEPPLDLECSEYEPHGGKNGPIEPLEVGGREPKRQGDPRYDPLAELYPQEPGGLDEGAMENMQCVLHNHWLPHCGCRPEHILPPTTSHSGPAPPTGYQYVLVEEDEEEECEDGEVSSHRRSTRLVCRINPFRIMEYLQLGLEEAFFLVYALGCLSVYYHEEPLTIACLWERFCSAQPGFCSTYAAYHYFRAKGWVPKVGMKYGADLLLYRKGPPFYHASYSVVVEVADDSFHGATLRPFSWRSLAALSRITGNVSKELMLCYVIRPSGLTREELSSPECIKRMKIQEIIISRWVSSRERTEQEEI
ncbi:tRNA-splicing endonuclease subunit Sen2 isoform X1 [Paramormyrops kingsleyae]|uniref:tRNA-splicing endonuclease subunit Sen2 n=1 Tax=Paramormyrops kingsleyae TaxID=1676925 RepID=A0A3B3QWS0_9TELE|nr:tRNA-splicing endonuclease subunit Sen2 isoform X1 [Paramormyrops kingsleyae]